MDILLLVDFFFLHQHQKNKKVSHIKISFIFRQWCVSKTFLSISLLSHTDCLLACLLMLLLQRENFYIHMKVSETNSKNYLNFLLFYDLCKQNLFNEKNCQKGFFFLLTFTVIFLFLPASFLMVCIYQSS